MRNHLKKLLLTLMLIAGTASVLAACNTTEGIGKDVSAAGDALAKSADDNKGY